MAGNLLGVLEADRREIALRRGPHNRLGFAYQVAFVRVLGRFPQQAPLEIDGEILRFAALQLGADAETIHAYERRQQTVSEHQQRIGEYLRLRTFDTAAGERLARFLEDEAPRLDRTASLLARARGWPRDEHVLAPADSVLRRAVGAARHKARALLDIDVSWVTVGIEQHGAEPAVALNDPVDGVALRLEHVVEAFVDPLPIAVEELAVHVDGLVERVAPRLVQEAQQPEVATRGRHLAHPVGRRGPDAVEQDPLVVAVVGDDELRARLLSIVPEEKLREDQSDLASWTRGDRKARFEQTAERHAGLSQFAAPFLSRMKFVDEQGEGASTHTMISRNARFARGRRRFGSLSSTLAILWHQSRLQRRLRLDPLRQ